MSFDQVTADLIRQVRERDVELAAVRAQANDDKRELDTLREAYAAAKPDAERYRLLRKYIVDSYIACGSGERLDAEIDAAMLAERGIGAA